MRLTLVVTNVIFRIENTDLSRFHYVLIPDRPVVGILEAIVNGSS